MSRVSCEGDIFRNSYALAKGGRTGGPSGSGGGSGSGSRGDVAGSARQPFRRSFFSSADNGPQEEPIASSFPSVMRGLKPNPFGQQRLRSTNFPFGCAEFLARQIRRPSPSSACAPALRVQAARAGLFCAAPRGTRWRWASGPRRETNVIVVDDEPVSREATFSAIHTPSRKGGRTGGPSGSGGRSRSGSRGGRRGFSAPAISEILFSRANNGPQEEPIASSFPSVMRGLKPNPFGRQRLRSTNFPFGYAEFLARQIRRPSPSSACAPALRVQAARAGLFCAAPRGTRWRWASGPRRKKKDHRNGFQPLQVLPQA